MSNSKGREILGKANVDREEGKILSSMQTADTALIEFQKESNLSGIAESLAVRVLALRRFYSETSDVSFLILAKHVGEAGVELAEKSGDKTSLAIPLFQLAQTYKIIKDYNKAISAYKKAIEHLQNHPPEAHNRPGVLADFKINLSVTEYLSGDKSALEKLNSAIADLEKTDEDSYNKNVWLSGAHMDIANMLKEDNLELAKEHLAKAKGIIDSDERLKLRKKDWEKLAQSFEK